MKNIILCFFIIPVITLSALAQEVTFNDFEEITHESKPALRHKKTKEIYPITFSEKFYSPDKTMYAVFADAIIEKWYKTKAPDDYELYRFIYIFNYNNKRIFCFKRALEEMSSLTEWRGIYLRIDEGPGWSGRHYYINPVSGLSYSGGNEIPGYGLGDYWITDNEIWFMEFSGMVEIGTYCEGNYIRFQIHKKILSGDKNGVSRIIFPISKFNDYRIHSEILPLVIRNNNDLRSFKTITLKKRYFNYISGKEYPSDTYKHTFSRLLEVDKSGKILSTTIPPDQFGVCLADNVRIRTSPDLNGTVVGHLKKDDTFEILDASETTQAIDTMEAYWYKIKTTTLTGWVYGYFIIGKPAENDQR